MLSIRSNQMLYGEYILCTPPTDWNEADKQVKVASLRRLRLLELPDRAIVIAFCMWVGQKRWSVFIVFVFVCLLVSDNWDGATFNLLTYSSNLLIFNIFYSLLIWRRYFWTLKWDMFVHSLCGVCVFQNLPPEHFFVNS